MRYFLPMVRPSNGNEDGSYYYDVNLDLAKMPAGLTTGEYAFAVVHNMRTMRSVEQYSQKTDILPNLSWSTLVAHVQAYGAANGWDEDGPEKTVEAMLHNGARTNEHWVSDLVEWPFSGDRCLLAWCDAVVSQSMLRKRKSETEHGNHPETNGNSCTHLGRWLSQRPHLLPMLPDVVVRLVEYVETVDSMPDYAFDAFVSKYHSSDVQHCEGLHERRLDDGPQFKRKLATAAVARLRDKSFKAADPWGSYADGLYNAWAIDHHDDEVEAQTALGLFTAWLDQWQHPFQEDMRMMAMIAGDASSMGNWLSQTVAQKEAEKEWQKESQNDPQILLHELLDSPLEERVKTDPQKEPQKEWQNDPQGTTSAAAAPPPASPQEKIPPKQDFAVTHPNDYWNVGGLF